MVNIKKNKYKYMVKNIGEYKIMLDNYMIENIS